MHVESIQVFSESTLLLVRKRAEWKANIEENVESQSSDVAVADFEIDQGSNALVWSEMETE
jgi:predicted nucleic acid-binding protein